MFPVTSRFLLWGHSIMRTRPDRHKPTYQDIRDLGFVRRANALAVRFANRLIFSYEDRHQDLVERYWEKITGPLCHSSQDVIRSRNTYEAHIWNAQSEAKMEGATELGCMEDGWNEAILIRNGKTGWVSQRDHYHPIRHCPFACFSYTGVQLIDRSDKNDLSTEEPRGKPRWLRVDSW